MLKKIQNDIVLFAKTIFLIVCIQSFYSQNKPIILEQPIILSIKDNIPQASIDNKYNDYLKTSCRITTNAYQGSGTIIGYNQSNNTAFILSCGHLFENNAEFMNKKASFDVTCSIDLFFNKSNKLNSPETYTGTVLFYYSNEEKDISLIKFHPNPNSVPNYTQIASSDNQLTKNLHSVGCDRGSDPGHYIVRIYGEFDKEYRTRYNSPRPGRSGGGLFLESKELVGICCRTSSREGTGFGYFANINLIRKSLIEEGYENLIK